MTSNRSIYRRALDRMQRRFHRARPGSVLIMVVALLVLMALIGTAYITTAQTDRYSAQQNAFNTEIDLLVQGVINMVDGRLVEDLYDQNASGLLPAQVRFRSAGATQLTRPVPAPAAPTIIRRIPMSRPSRGWVTGSRSPRRCRTSRISPGRTTRALPPAQPIPRSGRLSAPPDWKRLAV